MIIFYLFEIELSHQFWPTHLTTLGGLHGANLPVLLIGLLTIFQKSKDL